MLDKIMIIMKVYIFIFIYCSIAISQFSEVVIDIDYSNINDNEMFMFDSFEQEIKTYFLNNYFFDEPDELDLTIELHMIIESINNKGGEKIISAQILFSNKKFSNSSYNLQAIEGSL